MAFLKNKIIILFFFLFSGCSSIPSNTANSCQIFNERHYGALTGLNKVEMGEKLGKDKIYEFRRSWDIKPDP